METSKWNILGRLLAPSETSYLTHPNPNAHCSVPVQLIADDAKTNMNTSTDTKTT